MEERVMIFHETKMDEDHEFIYAKNANHKMEICEKCN